MTVAKRFWTLSAVTLTAALTACGGGGGGGGGGGNSTPVQRSLAVVPNQASVEATQVLTLNPAVVNVSSPQYTYALVPPDSLAKEAADVIAAKFGTLDTEKGVFTTAAEPTEGLRGSILVKETTFGLQVEVPLLIVPGILSVTVAPASASVLAGQTATFTATALDFFEQEVPNLLVDWRSGELGKITSGGVFTGLTAGTGEVTATVGLAPAGTAEVTVIGSIVGLSILPVGNPVEVEAGTTRQFRAVVGDAQGNQVAVPATWSLSDPALGTIDANGLFTAGAAGLNGTLTASAEGQTATVPMRTVALITPPSALPGNVVGTLKQTGGAAAAGVAVVATRKADNQEFSRTTTDADGAFGLFLPVGTFTLSATSGGLVASQEVTVVSQDERLQVNLVLAPAG